MHLSNKRKPGWLGYIGDHTTQLYIIGIIISHYKDPYKTTRTMERRRVFFVPDFNTRPFSRHAVVGDHAQHHQFLGFSFSMMFFLFK